MLRVFLTALLLAASVAKDEETKVSARSARTPRGPRIGPLQHAGRAAAASATDTRTRGIHAPRVSPRRSTPSSASTWAPPVRATPRRMHHPQRHRAPHIAAHAGFEVGVFCARGAGDGAAAGAGVRLRAAADAVVRADSDGAEAVLVVDERPKTARGRGVVLGNPILQ